MGVADGVDALAVVRVVVVEGGDGVVDLRVELDSLLKPALNSIRYANLRCFDGFFFLF